MKASCALLLLGWLLCGPAWAEDAATPAPTPPPCPAGQMRAGQDCITDNNRWSVFRPENPNTTGGGWCSVGARSGAVPWTWPALALAPLWGLRRRRRP